MGGDQLGIDRLRSLAVRSCVFALAAVAFVRAGPTTHELIAYAREDGPPGTARAAADLRLSGVNTRFIEWARGRIGASARYWIASSNAQENVYIHQWLTFRLLPSEPVERARDADAVIWVADKVGPHRLPGFRHVDRYTDGFGVALRDRPSQ